MIDADSTEIQLLGGAILLGFIQLNLAAIAARRQQGLRWGAGARDEERPVTGVAARLSRAHANFMETFPFYVAALLAAALAAKLGPLTWWGSWLYVSARLAYVPLYAFGVPYVRTAVWHVAVLGIAMIWLAVFG
jgi:uncharacterized MAPEG superfamily protein